MTRYPKKGKGTKWTQKELLAIPAQWVNDTLADGDGLIGEVRVSKVGDVSIRFKYGLKWQGKKCWYSCGTFPLNDISSIRNQRDKAKELLKQGIDPRTQKHIDKIEAKAEQQTILEQQKKQQQRNKTFTDLFTTWIEQGVVRQDANIELRRTFEKDVLPVIGSVLIKEITEDHIRTVYKTILARGTQQNPRERTVVKLAADMRQLFKWADMRQPWRSLLINGNPALLVNEKQLISADYTEERDRTLTPEEIQTLYQLIQQEQDHYNNATHKRGIKLPLNPATQCAIWICLSTLCRIGELLMAKWEHIDWEEGIWFIPRENVKATRGKKQDHYIYLSDFSVRYFKQLNTLTGHTQWCFPSKDNTSHVDIKSVSKRIGDRQVKFKDRTKPSQQRRHDNSLAVGNSEWTPHDLRRTGATMMQELGIDINIIDRCQNHVLAGSKVRRHYLKYEYKDEKQQAWAKLGKRLEEIINR